MNIVLRLNDLYLSLVMTNTLEQFTNCLMLVVFCTLT
jgi:hypothetical protein